MSEAATSETKKATTVPSTAGINTILYILSGAFLIVSFSESMLIPALPTIQQEFNTTATVVAWIPGIYLLVGAVVTPIFGKLGDTYGKKKFLVIVMVLYTISVILDGFAWSIGSLLVFRAIQGFGLAMFPLAIAIIRDTFPLEKIAVSSGIISAMNGVGASIGLVGGGYITQTFSWQTNYHFLAPFAVAITFLTWWKVRESPIRTPETLDIIGAVLFAVSIISLLVGLSEAAAWGWTSLSTIGIFALWIVFTILFVVWELREKQPLINFKIPRERDILKINFGMFIAGFAMFSAYESVIYFGRTPPPVGFGLNTFDTALMLVPGSLTILIAGPLAGRLVKSRGPRPVSIMGALILLGGFVVMALFDATPPEFSVGIMVLMFGIGFLFVALINFILLIVPPSMTGAETGLNTIFRFIGQSVGSVLAGSVLALRTAPLVITIDGTTQTILEPTTQAFNILLGLGVILSLIALLLAWWLPREPSEHGAALRPPTQQDEEEPK